MAYVDAVVVPVPKRKLAAYSHLARLSGKIWRGEHGASNTTECAADDVKPGKRTSFPQSVQAQIRRDGSVRVPSSTSRARSAPASWPRS